MSLWTRFVAAIVGPAETPTEFRESAGATVDADDHEWRALTGNDHRDLAPMTQDRMQKLAHHLWESNLLANRLIELPLAYLLAKGVAIRVDDEACQEAIDAHWRDGINAWDIKLVKKLRELSMFGEQVWPVFTGHSGFVRIGYLDPSRIATVVSDPDNIEQPIGIVTKTDTRGKVLRYRVLVNGPEDVFTRRTQEIRETLADGDVFFFKINDLCSSTRGRSDILAQADWLDAYDQFLFGELDRAGFLRSFMWDVTLKGATPDEVAARAKSIAPPKPGSVRVHNDAEQWKAETPSLQAADSGAAARVFRNHVLGGATLPPTWYADGEDANRANSQSMAEPTEKMLEMRQRFVGYMLVQVGQYVLRAKFGALDRELTKEEQKILNSIVVDWPEMTTKDTTKYAAALQQCVTAAVAMIQSKLVTRATAARLIAAIAAQLGVEFDVEAELTAVEEEAAKIAAEDGFMPGKVDDTEEDTAGAAA
ncbi:MAG: hypothetical protein HYV17_08010 [Xanthomonadales bacterium]|nr:hypothetical protein [Xanthomonadales bacterium]